MFNLNISYTWLVFAVALNCFVMLSPEAVAQEKITLRQAVETALKNNLQIKQAQLQVSLTEQDVKQSKLALLPNLNANTNLNFNFGRSVDPFSYQFVNQQITSVNGGVSTGFTVFQGGQKLSQISQNKFLLEADKSNARRVQNDLALNVATNYLGILNNRDLLAAALQQLDLTKLQLEREQKQFDVGNKTLADLSQAKAQMATAELNVTNAQNNLDISYLNLAQQMERNPADSFAVVAPQIDEIGQLNSAYSAAEIYTTAVDNYPDIKFAEFNTLAAKQAVRVARGSLFPRLDLQAGLGSGYSSAGRQFRIGPNGTPVSEKSPFGSQLNSNLNQSVGFGLSIPIFNGLASGISVTRAKIQFQNASIAEQSAKNNLNKVISQAVLDLRASQRRYYSAQTAFQSSKEVFRVIDQRYTVGLVNSLDYNQSQTNLNKAQFDLIQAKYDLIFRSKVIDFYLGNPLQF